MKKIGETIKRRRVALGYTQEYVANQIKVTIVTVYKWENDIHFPQGRHLIELSDMLRIPIRQLF